MSHKDPEQVRRRTFHRFRAATNGRENRCAIRVFRAQAANSPYYAPKWCLTNAGLWVLIPRWKQPLTREVVVNKSQLVDKIVADTAMGKRDVEKVIGAFIDTVQQSVKKGEKVSLPGFRRGA